MTLDIKFRQQITTGGATINIPPSDNDLLRGAYWGGVIQDAIDTVKALGGGRVVLGVGTYPTTICLVLPGQVSLVGQGMDATIIQKVGSAVSLSASAVYSSRIGTTPSAPNAVLHMVEINGGSPINWSFGEVRDFSVNGDGTGAVDSNTAYGVYSDGLNNCLVSRVLARYCGVGHFHGTSILTEFSGNIATRCARGFYIHFATSMNYMNNYANRVRFMGHDVSFYYSAASANACDAWGDAEQGWVSTDIATAYRVQSSFGSTFLSNGAETGNGGVWEISNNVGCAFLQNFAIDVYSNHNNTASGLNVYLLYMTGNVDCEYRFNRFCTRVGGLGGSADPAKHYNWGVGTSFGKALNFGNRFCDDNNRAATTDDAWDNTSGTWTAT